MPIRLVYRTCQPDPPTGPASRTRPTRTTGPILNLPDLILTNIPDLLYLIDLIDLLIIFIFVFRLYLGHNRIGFVDKDAFNGVDRLIELVDLEGIVLF